MRTATSIVLVAGLLASLAACSSPTTTADCDPTPAGKVSDAVTVTGDFGKEPVVKFDIPVASDATERTVAIEGDGEVATAGDTVNVQFTIYSGNTSAAIAGTDYTEATLGALAIDEATGLPGIVKTLDCSAVGSRIVGVIPPVDAFGDTGSEQLNIQAGEDIVFVVDIISIAEPVATPDSSAPPALPKADGADQPAVAGLPTVVLAEDGTPTITIPDATPPTDLQLAVLKQGDGAIIEPGSDVVVHYVGMNWNTKAVFDSSWERGAPATFNTGGVIPGFTQALEGQQVGSQVLVVIPPDLGYGPQGGRAPDISATDTLVFVIDILGVG